MISEIIKNKTDASTHLIDNLMDTIIEYKISNLEDLNELENRIFTVHNKVLNEDERIEYCVAEIRTSYADIDGLDYDTTLKVVKLKEKLLKEKLTNQEKIKLLIKIYDLTNRDCKFLTEAYNLIINKDYE